jgi:hypothetical protein
MKHEHKISCFHDKFVKISPLHTSIFLQTITTLTDVSVAVYMPVAKFWTAARGTTNVYSVNYLIANRHTSHQEKLWKLFFFFLINIFVNYRLWA